MKEIQLTRGHVALVDDEDFERLCHFRWHSTGLYASRSEMVDGRRVTVYMHRAVLSAPLGVEVDHVNCDGFDNRRCNLRLATRQENNRNMRGRARSATSAFKGVFFERERSLWRASMSVNNRTVYLGRFQDEVEAARAYDIAAQRLFGEFARLNFPRHTLTQAAA